MVQQLDQWIAQVGPVAYLVLGLAAMLEYIFPPFPGDTVTLLGGVYAVRGQKPWPLVLAVLTLGSVVGAAIDYWVGTRLYRWLEGLPDDEPFLGLTRAQLREAEAKMRRRGALLVLINRFLPGVRGVIFFAAGAARMPFGRVMILGTLSASVFNLGILGLGIVAGGNAERLEQMVRSYQHAIYVLLGLVALAVGARLLSRRRSRKPA